jgi:NAD(P)-dependent dehydrogenase (short-subunit alcohol dehydrogenase family)
MWLAYAARMSKHHTYILTGASRGLGLSMARQLRGQGHRLLTLSRHPNAELDGPGVEQWAVDLARPAHAAAQLSAWVAALPRGEIASLSLINNAAGLAALAPLGDIEADDLSAALRVGLEAPMLLASAFLRASADLSVPRRVLNISSGLGRFAMAGSAVYCAAKAGLDHLSRAVALEEAARPNGAKIVSLAPGVVDTDMQLQLRSADPAAFADAARFASMKAEGRLDSAESAAAKVLAWLASAGFGSHPIGDVREPIQA